MMKDRRNRSITLQLIIANSIFFLAMLPITYRNPAWVDYIALIPSKILSSERLWTLVTSMFMHASIPHLFVNMMSLMFLGSSLERIIGRKRFAVFYIVSGIFSGLFFVASAFLFRQDLNIGAVGASGAIFGIAGMLAVLVPKLPVYIMFIPIAMHMWFAVILLLLVLWIFSLVSGVPIGNTAHLGGLIIGFVYGFYLRTRYKRKVLMLNKFLLHRGF
ncbi:rhomboid family intramembrane serine protease [Candidatus Pacearchaeota archaeon]|nr:rhomboid family intramembrane serine protease [Candidatus Pacearchaeota archaeon]